MPAAAAPDRRARLALLKWTEYDALTPAFRKRLLIQHPEMVLAEPVESHAGNDQDSSHREHEHQGQSLDER
jgi:hypothetical protein